MSVFTPKGPYHKPAGFVEPKEEIIQWWEKNKDKRWNPVYGLYDSNEEPTDNQLKEIEESPNFKEIINSAFNKRFTKKHKEFVGECEKSLDKGEHGGYVSLREVANDPVTSLREETPDQQVPSSCNNSAVVPDSVTSTTNDETKTPNPSFPRANNSV